MRGSVAGSIVSNILLVLGAALVFGVDGARLDRRSLWQHLALVLGAVLLFLIPSIPGWHGDPNRHSLAVLSVAPAIVLLLVYIVVTAYELRGSQRVEPTLEHAWPLRRALVALGIATALTAAISEVLVHSLTDFAHTAHLSEFFISAVIVAIVGNAAEHGGAIVIARRGKMKLATEIAVSSSAQVGLLVVPAVTLLSFFFSQPLTLAFRPVELLAMGTAAVVVAVVVRDGRAQHSEGALLIGLYLAVVVVFGIVGDINYSGTYALSRQSPSTPAQTPDLSTAGRIGWYGTLRGRAGLAADDSLIYVTAGFALSDGRTALT